MQAWTEKRLQILCAFLMHDAKLFDVVASKVQLDRLSRDSLRPEMAVILSSIRHLREELGQGPWLRELVLDEVNATLQEEWPRAQQEDPDLAMRITEWIHAIMDWDPAKLRARSALGRKLLQRFLTDFHYKPQLERLSQSRLQGPNLREKLTELLTELPSDESEEEPAPLNAEELLQTVRQAPEGLKTGWNSLDGQGLRIRPGELTTIAARLAHAKTSFLLNLTHFWAKSGVSPVVFVSYEMPLVDVFRTCLACKGGTVKQQRERTTRARARLLLRRLPAGLSAHTAETDRCVLNYATQLVVADILQDCGVKAYIEDFVLSALTTHHSLLREVGTNVAAAFVIDLMTLLGARNSRASGACEIAADGIYMHVENALNALKAAGFRCDVSDPRTASRLLRQTGIAEEKPGRHYFGAVRLRCVFIRQQTLTRLGFGPQQ